MSLEQAKKLVENVKIALMTKHSFYYFMLNSMEVRYSDEEDANHSPMGMFGHMLVIRKSAFEDFYAKKYPVQMVKHEILHLALEHTARLKELVTRLMNNAVGSKSDLYFMINLAMDAKVNFLLEKEGEDVSWGFNGKEWWSEEEIENDSIEEMVMKKIADAKIGVVPFGCKGDLLGEMDEGDSLGNGNNENGNEEKSVGAGSGEEKKTGGSQQLQKGDSRFEGIRKDEFQETVKKIVAESFVKAKIAGVGAGESLRVLEDELLKPKKQLWHERFRNCLKGVLIKSRISDWRIVNRKLPNVIAGSRIIRKPKMCCCIDVSGSIGDNEYAQFAREILNFMREGEVTAIFWDDGIREVRKVARKEHLEKSVPGGGGTMFSPVLSSLQLKQSLIGADVLVVLTDGWWFDTDKAVSLLKKIRCYKVLLTTERQVEGFDMKIKIERED